MAEVVAHIQNGINYMVVSGDAEMTTVSDFRSKLFALSFGTNFSVVELDLSKMTYMDSSGLSVLIGFFKALRQAGKSVSIISMPEAIEELVDLAGLQEFVREQP